MFPKWFAAGTLMLVLGAFAPRNAAAQYQTSADPPGDGAAAAPGQSFPPQASSANSPAWRAPAQMPRDAAGSQRADPAAHAVEPWADRPRDARGRARYPTTRGRNGAITTSAPTRFGSLRPTSPSRRSSIGSCWTPVTRPGIPTRWDCSAPTQRTLRVYHTPQIQAVVGEMVDRFVNSEAESHAFGLRVLTVGSPNWRSKAHPVLHPVPAQSQGVQAWLLPRKMPRC